MDHHFNPNVAKEFGIVEAVFIQNLYYWISKNRANNKNFHDGRYWTYNSSKAWNDLFIYLTKRQIEYALKRLIDAGVIIRGNYNKNKFDRTSWFAFSDLGISKLHFFYSDITNFVNGDSNLVTSYNETNNKPNNNLTDNNPNNSPLVSSANATETLPPKGESEFELKPEEKEPVSSKAKNEYTPEFESFWKIYKTKRSEGKAPAFKQWLKAIKKIKPEDLIKVLEAHIREWDFKNTHAQYIPHARTWLSQERFLDELDNKQDYGSHSIYYGDGETTF